MGDDLRSLRTPRAVVDGDVLERNVETVGRRAREQGVRLRPHVKTHRTVEAARSSIAGHFGGVTVSTLAEAAALADAGFRDVTHAVPLAPAKLSEVLALQQRLDRLSILVDGDAALQAMEATPGTDTFSVFLELDCGGRRSGVDPASAESVAVAARLAASPRVDFRGVLTHAGHAYACRDAAEARVVAEQERDVSTTFADRLRSEGIDVPDVSVGSTPTVRAAEDWTGVTEIRPGNHVFFDAFQLAIGSCTFEDLAFSVLATVTSVQPDRRRCVVDAGALALSKDAGPTHVDPDCGFGLACTAEGERIPGVRVASLSQEHGVLHADDADAFADWRPGRLVRIVPNHSCLAAACFDDYVVVRDGRPSEEWRRIRGW